jgi:MFS family permease
MYSAFFIGALYLEHVLGYDALKTGFAFLPVTLTVAVLSLGITARLVSRFGPRRVLFPAMLCVVAALLLLSQVGVDQSYAPLLLVAFTLMGVGIGAASVPLLTIAMADVPLADAGLASGVVNVSMQIAGALGVAVFSTIAANRTKTLLALGHPVPSALTGGYQLAFLIGAATVGVGVLVAATVLRPRQRRAETAAAVAPPRLESSGERPPTATSSV